MIHSNEGSPITAPLEIVLDENTAARFRNASGLWIQDSMTRHEATQEHMWQLTDEVLFFQGFKDSFYKAISEEKPFSFTLIPGNEDRRVTMAFKNRRVALAWDGCGIFLARVFTPNLLGPEEETKREMKQGMDIADALRQGREVSIRLR